MSSEPAAYRIPFPAEAIDPVVSKYIEFWFGRLPNEKTRDGKKGETPLIEAARIGDEASVFMILFYAFRLKHQYSTTSSTLEAHEEDEDEDEDDAYCWNTRIVNVNARRDGPNRCTALHCAASQGSVAIVNMLLQCGADKSLQLEEDATSCTPLMRAARAGHEGVTLLLLGHDDWTEETMDRVFRAAIGGRKESLVRRLVQHYLDQEDQIRKNRLTQQQQQHATCHDMSCPGSPMEDLLGLIALRLAYSFFHLSTPCQESLICQLIEQGADFTKSRQTLLGHATLLAIAIHYNLESVVKLLIQKGAHTHGTVISLVDCGDCNALHLASRDGRNFAIVQLLLDSGMSVNESTKDCGVSPLHMAAKNGATAILPILLNKGADINARETKYGNTPLHWAIQRFPFKERIATEVVTVLLERGADVQITNRHGQTVMDVAMEEETQWIDLGMPKTSRLVGLLETAAKSGLS